MTVQLLDQLESFVRAVDNMSPEIVQRVLETIVTYKGSGLKYEVLLPGAPARDDASSRALIQKWGSYSDHRPIPLRNSGPYSGHAEYCWRENREIWIHAKDGGLLRDAEEYDNAYGNGELPKYKAYAGEASRVSIVRLIRDGRNDEPMGIFTIESQNSLEHSRSADAVLTQLIQIIAVLIRSERESQLNSDNTKKAADQLVRMAKSSSTFSSLCHKPIIFHSYADVAARDVRRIVCNAAKVISEINKAQHGLGIKLRDWRDSARPSHIVPELLDELRQSVAGIAYLSERSEMNSGRFADNPNVLYEAGIMQGLAAPFRGYLVIREADSASAVPFDLAQKRTILVKRDRDGSISDEKSIEEQIVSALSELLSDEL